MPIFPLPCWSKATGTKEVPTVIGLQIDRDLQKQVIAGTRANNSVGLVGDKCLPRLEDNELIISKHPYMVVWYQCGSKPNDNRKKPYTSIIHK